jgi:glycosyltransferase involved in cell wall biosynthesis
MAKIGVLHVVDCLNVGGTERQLCELLRRLDRERFRPQVACFKSGGELLRDLTALGVTPIEFPLRGSLTQLNTAWQIARMAHWCKRTRVRIVHAHDFYANIIGVAAARLAGVRCIASRRDLAHWLTPTQRRGLRLACRFADLVVANASAVAEQTANHFGVAPARLRVVPNGIDVALFDRLARHPPHPPLPRRRAAAARVVMVASMHLPDKGHDDLLEAAAQLRHRGVAAQWLLVSDGALRPRLQQKANALGLTEDIHFLGRRSDVASVLVRADVVVHPSWAEGFPNAVLEAMCAARPVVATRVGGIPEVVVDRATGLLVTPKRPRELAEALAHMIANSAAAQRMGQRGRERVESVYQLQHMCTVIEDIYARLADRDSATPMRTSAH